MKKSNNEKLNKKPLDNVKIIIICVVIILVILAFLIIRLSKKSTLECMATTKDVATENRIVTISLDGRKITNIAEKRLIDFDDQSNMYKSVLKSSLENSYKDLKIDHEIKESKTSLEVTSNYGKDDVYVIDNVNFKIENGSVAINIIEQEASGKDSSMDLEKKHSKKAIKKVFNKFDYLCE